MNVVLSELDLDTLYRVARGMAYKQIALLEGLTEQTIKNRMSLVMQLFGATSITYLVAMLIASDVLRVQDLYQEIDVTVREYRRRGRSGRYRLAEVRG